jgi:hypothetical protein
MNHALYRDLKAARRLARKQGRKPKATARKGRQLVRRLDDAGGIGTVGLSIVGSGSTEKPAGRQR